jgi:hypothetical protein
MGIGKDLSVESNHVFDEHINWSSEDEVMKIDTQI